MGSTVEEYCPTCGFVIHGTHDPGKAYTQFCYGHSEVEEEDEDTPASPKRYRKLRLELNTRTPKQSRILDIESGDEILVEDAQIVCGRATQYGIEVILTLASPASIEITTKEE